MAATVRVSGPPNSSFLVGYPGISATLVRAGLQGILWLVLIADSRLATD